MAAGYSGLVSRPVNSSSATSADPPKPSPRKGTSAAKSRSCSSAKYSPLLVCAFAGSLLLVWTSSHHLAHRSSRADSQWDANQQQLISATSAENIPTQPNRALVESADSAQGVVPIPPQEDPTSAPPPPTPSEDYTCDRSNPRSDICHVSGDIRLDQRTNLVVLFPQNPETRRGLEYIKPYARKWDENVVTLVWQFSVWSTDTPAPPRARPSPRTETGEIGENGEKGGNGENGGNGGSDLNPKPTAAWTGPPDPLEHKLRALDGSWVHTDQHNWRLFEDPKGGSVGPGEKTVGNLHCDYAHNVPLVIFSAGGYKGEVILGLAQYSKHWLAKYGAILGVLSNYPPIMLGASEEVHCFGEAMVGLEAHEEFRVNPERMPNGEMMVDFQKVLKAAFASNASLSHWAAPTHRDPPKLKLEHSLVGTTNSDCDPLLTIIQRHGSRVLENAHHVVKYAQREGFAVQFLYVSDTWQFRHIWQVLQESDVMLGVHGAAMTHFVFMRPHSVFIQLLPLATGWPAEEYYGKPAMGLGLHYIQEQLEPFESSLSRIYNKDDPILADPQSIYDNQGYWKVKEIYFDNQNVTWSRLKAITGLKQARMMWVRSRFKLEMSERDRRCQEQRQQAESAFKRGEVEPKHGE